MAKPTATSKSYQDKLKDPRWQKKRLKILERDDWACQLCEDTETTLNVHHKRYIRGRDPWDYDDEDLETLCRVCHGFKTLISKIDKGVNKQYSDRLDLENEHSNRLIYLYTFIQHISQSDTWIDTMLETYFSTMMQGLLDKLNMEFIEDRPKHE